MEPQSFTGPACQTCGVVLEADHRIANHLALISGFVALRMRDLMAGPDPPGREAVRLSLESIQTQIHAISALHRRLAGEGRVGDLPVDALLHEVCAPLAGVLAGRVTLVEDLASGCALSSSRALALGQIVSEAVTNAAKHGSLAADPPPIVVRSRRGDPDGLVVEVFDGGPGPAPGVDAGAGLGSRVIAALSRSLDADCGYRTDAEGTCFRIVVRPPPPLTVVNVEGRSAGHLDTAAGVRPAQETPP